jgi:pimeloyl-ACP methyl ester carboxylesterase
MGDADQEIMVRTDVREWFTEVMRESFQQGGRAAAYEAGLYRSDWGFDPGEIKARTRLWYGGADETVPSSAGQWLADRMSGSDYTLWPRHGHFTWMVDDEAADAIVATTTASDWWSVA